LFPPQGKYETLACSEYIKLHADVVRQVSFIESLHSFVSASESVITKSAYLPSVVIVNLGIQETKIVFKMNSVSGFLNDGNFAAPLETFPFSLFNPVIFLGHDLFCF
jgi:hypothetical protein